MNLKEDVHHPNDVTNTFLAEIMPDKVHHYFQLPGKFVRNYPTKIILRDASEREMDWLMLVEPDNEKISERMLINVEFQSVAVNENKLRTIADYRDYAKTYFGLPVLNVIIITDGYEKSKLTYGITDSDILKPTYIYLSEDEVKN